MGETGQTATEEPIGIIISRGAEKEAVPRMRACIWGQAEDVVQSAVREQAA